MLRVPEAVYGSHGDHFRVFAPAPAYVAAGDPPYVRVEETYQHPPDAADPAMQHENRVAPDPSHSRDDEAARRRHGRDRRNHRSRYHLRWPQGGPEAWPRTYSDEFGFRACGT